MNHKLDNLNKNQVKITIELDQYDLAKYVNKAEEIIGKKIEIKGFRRGKVPRDLLKNHLDQDKVRSLALEIAVEESLSDTVKNNSLDVLNTSKLSISKNDATQLAYSVIVDLFPEIKLADLRKIKVKRKSVDVQENEIADALGTIKNSRATLVDKKENETAEKGDRVEVDFEVKKDDQVIKGGLSKNHPLVIGGQSFIAGFEEELIGMKKGQEKSFSLVAPDDYFYKEVAGKKLDFTVKLNDLKKVIAPEVNDEFAKSIGRFANLGELEKSIKEGLIQEKRLKEGQKLRLEILDSIIHQSEIEAPDNLVNEQLDTMVSDFDSNLHEKGLELSLYLARIGKTHEEFKKDWSKDAEKQVKASLVLRKIAQERDIKASEEEIEEMANQAIQAALAMGEVDPNGIDLLKIKENVASRIVNEKTLEYIESQCAV